MINDMYDKIIVVGCYKYKLYAKAFFDAWKQLGYQNVYSFSTDLLIDDDNKIRTIIKRVENKFSFGIDVIVLNHKLKMLVSEVKPDLVFLYSPRNVWPETVEWMKLQGAIVMLYNNDDPFSVYYPNYFWRLFVKNIPYADITWGYRFSNLEAYKKAGAKEVKLLRAYYREKYNFYDKAPTVKEYVPKVVFLGHYEADEREDYITYATENGIEIGISAHAYEQYSRKNKNLVKLELAGTEYNAELNAAQIALVFLSSINHDTYTRRCFEIPATKTMMLSVYTDDLANMYEEDKEIVFFRTKEELVEKLRYYLNNEDAREQIALAGYNRVLKDGHEAKDRVKQIMEEYERLKA